MLEKLWQQVEKPLDRLIREVKPWVEMPKFRILRLSESRVEVKIFLNSLTKDVKNPRNLDTNEVVAVTLTVARRWLEGYQWQFLSLLDVHFSFDPEASFMSSVKVILQLQETNVMWEPQGIFGILCQGQVVGAGGKPLGQVRLKLKAAKKERRGHG